MACGYQFIYNNIPSEIFNVSLVFLDEDYNNRPSGSGVEIVTDSIQRNPQLLYLYGKQSPSLEFGIEIVFENPVDIFVLTEVKDWIGGEISFKKLQICAEYFNSFYFNCYITLDQDLIYNGGYRGVKATVHCDSPWAWEFDDERKYSLNPNIENVITFNNLSADSELLRPEIIFRMSQNGDFRLTNKTTNKTTIFSDLNADEVVYMDNLYGFIESSTGLIRVGNFNKVFLKLKKGINELIVGPNVDYFSIKYKNAKRIGGGYY